MDAETIKAILDLPIMGVLIFLLYRENAAKEKLMALLIEQARQHSEHLMQMACHGYYYVEVKRQEDLQKN